jgi:epoxyqueuosine reductase
LIVVALSYVDAAAATPPSTDFPVGFIARYARGDDYHEVIHRKLRALADECASILGRPVASRRCVDTAPLLEREAAAAGGLGFIAKSTLTIVPGIGSYVLLGELLVDVELTPDRPVEPRCGECTRCLVACPTGAFVDEYVLDARRCVSYLTIELRGPIARELRPKMGTMVVGCDVCQEVCPFNPPATPLVTLRPRPSAPELAQDTSRSAPNLLELLNLTTGEYRRLTRGRPLRRVSRVQLARNAAVALGNLRDPGTVSTLRATLLYHRSALVRGHVAWALGRLATPAAVDALNAAREREGDPYVLDELAHAGHLATAPTPS